MSTLNNKTETDRQDIRGVSRNNLLLLTRLVIRGLLENSMLLKCRMLHAEHQQLLDFFVMVDKVMRHGFKASRNVISLKTPDQELWCFMEKVGKLSKELEESVTCIEQLPNVHSSVCRVRAWLRLAVMQKKLSDYFQTIIDAKDLLNEYYEDWALLRNETSSVVFVGSLIGLRVLDCNLYLKEDDLRKQPLDVDLNSYIKIPTVSLVEENSGETEPSPEQISEHETDVKTVLDQKSYLEERNRMLIANNENLRRRLVLLEGMRRHKSASIENTEKGIVVAVDEFDSMDLPPMDKTDELETAMSLLEKSVHEKQDTIVSLRQQIDDIKKINLDLYQKLRALEESGKGKDKLISRLEKEIEGDKSFWQNKINTLEPSIKEAESRLKKKEEFIENLQCEITQKVEFCAQLQNDLVDLREVNINLETLLTDEKTARHNLESQLEMLKASEKERAKLFHEREQLIYKVRDYESALEEMGISLSLSKLKVEDLKEEILPLADAQWESDKEAQACKNCQKNFSVSRRRHHCRNCGGIYCSSCSENTLPLPSSSKPVRVCDACYNLLLQRFSAKNAPSSASSSIN